MLRRAPTSISLSNRDVVEHLEHIEQQKQHEKKKAQYRQSERIPYSQTSGFHRPLLGSCQGENQKKQTSVPEHEPYRRDMSISFYAVDNFDDQFQDDLVDPNAHANQDSPGRRLNQIARTEPVLDPCSGSEDEEGFTPITLVASTDLYDEGTVLLQQEYRRQPQRISPPGSDRGFVGTALDDTVSFDISTPATGQVRNIQRLRSRIPLPRSPLFYSHGANSPGKRATSSLTPCLPLYDTPGMLLSKPARRPKSYRPRSESYSYEESERASVGYDETQGSDNDSNGSRAPGEKRRDSQEDVYRRSLQEGRLERDLSTSPVPFTDSRRSRSGKASQPEQVAAENRIFYFSSPRLPLPLPPPFSAVPRDLSTAGSAPSMREEPHPRSSSTSPSRSGVRGLRASPVGHSSGSPGVEHAGSSSTGILHNLTSLPFRLLEAYRSRSPRLSHSDTSASDSTSSPQRRTSRAHSRDRGPASMASDQFRIYDDRRPASVQPQTPQQLPEARHQSQFHPSYTAPAGPAMGSIRRSGWQLYRQRRTRSDSPAGMEAPGYRGLYGGQENGDDEVTFSRAARRLMFFESAGGHSETLSSTPDRDLRFADNTGGHH